MLPTTQVKDNLTHKDIEYLYYLGVSNYETNNLERAIGIFQLLVIMEQKSEYFKALASCFFKQNKYDEALTYYKAAILINKDEDCLFFAGVCSYYLDKLNESGSFFNDYMENSLVKSYASKAKGYLDQIHIDLQ